MPICPGCEEKIPYSRLNVHERYCDGIRSPEKVRKHATEYLEYRIEKLEEQLEARTDAEFERRLVSLESRFQEPQSK